MSCSFVTLVLATAPLGGAKCGGPCDGCSHEQRCVSPRGPAIGCAGTIVPAQPAGTTRTAGIRLCRGRALGITCIACLAGPEEIEGKSPEYGRALREHHVPCEVRSFPIPDFDVPEDEAAFWRFADDTAASLKQGTAILMHCGAGIGRTGTMAAAVLMAPGRLAMPPSAR